MSDEKQVGPEGSGQRLVECKDQIDIPTWGVMHIDMTIRRWQPGDSACIW